MPSPNEAPNPNPNPSPSLNSSFMIQMPALSAPSAPSFDPAKPHSPKQYFTDLEFLMHLAAIPTEIDKKKHATRSVDIDTADLWESLSEFTSASNSYAEFKTAVMDLYPEADKAYTYTFADLDTIIGKHQRLGISTLTELADYHRRFTTITNFLISKNRLSEMEQKRAFILGFQPTLWSEISHRLQLTLPDQSPDEPYEIEVVHAAARFVLHGTSSVVNHPAPPQSTSSAGPEPVVNSDTLAPFFAELTNSILEVLKQTQNQNQPEQQQLENNPRRARVTNHDITGACNFCRKPPHSIRGCK